MSDRLHGPRLTLVRVNGSWVNPVHVVEVRAIWPLRARTEVFFVDGRRRELDMTVGEVLAILSGKVVDQTTAEGP